MLIYQRSSSHNTKYWGGVPSVRLPSIYCRLIGEGAWGKHFTDRKEQLDRVGEDEVTFLLESIFEQYGYDYRQYSRTHIDRRILSYMQRHGFESLEALRHRLSTVPSHAAELMQELSITVTEMFRDPEFHKAVREHVLPLLRTWSHIKIWHAGCSTGEEVYSMAILLKEAGLYDRTRIYATDLNGHALAKATDGIYPVELIRTYNLNYQRSGGQGSLHDHYHLDHDLAIMDGSLKKNILWSAHNLVTDSDFAEVQLVVCRNVLIYFDRELQQRVLNMFHRSLVNGGILCLGANETIDHTVHQHRYSAIDRRHRIYRKKYRITEHVGELHT